MHGTRANVFLPHNTRSIEARFCFDFLPIMIDSWRHATAVCRRIRGPQWPNLRCMGYPEERIALWERSGSRPRFPAVSSVCGIQLHDASWMADIWFHDPVGGEAAFIQTIALYSKQPAVLAKNLAVRDSNPEKNMAIKIKDLPIYIVYNREWRRRHHKQTFLFLIAQAQHGMTSL